MATTGLRPSFPFTDRMTLTRGELAASRQGKVAAEVIAGHKAAYDNRTVPADLRELQRQAALEKDDGDADRYQGRQQVTQQRIRIEHAKHRTGGYAGHQQEQDRRDAHPPGKPLAGEADDNDAAKGGDL